MTKFCKCCGNNKDDEKDFYKMPSGNACNVCKLCHTKRSNANKKTRPEMDFINNPELIIELCQK